MSGVGGDGSVAMNYLDTILVPISVFLTIGYHAYLWHYLKHNPSITSVGINSLKRRAWLRLLNQGNDKKGMVAVQSLRNTLMFAILTATITATIIVALSALTNNAYNAGRILDLFGSQSGRIVVVKFGLAAIFLLASFVCSSMAVGCLVDANFLINAIGEFSLRSEGDYTEAVLERGFTLAVVGNRLLCTAFPLLLWLFGPLTMAVASAAIVWALYQLDFVPKYYC